jgi:hypothetical protein
VKRKPFGSEKEKNSVDSRGNGVSSYLQNS